MRRFLLSVFVIILSYVVNAQVTVFTDNFSTSTGSTYSAAAGAIGTSTVWSLNRSGVDWGARIDGGILDLTNDATGSANVNGWVFGYTPTASFLAPYNTTLSSNLGVVTWTFNMRQIRTDPAGFGVGNYGVAFVLGGTSTTSATAGNGYAIVLGQAGGTDPIRLAKFTTGLQGTLTNIITSNTSGLTDFGSEYLSIKVTYTPSSNTWELFLRNDGSSSFTDPASGTLTSQGTAIDNTYTGVSLDYMGGYWQGSTGVAQTAYFDNTTVTITYPNTITTSNVQAPPFSLPDCVATASGTVDYTSTDVFNTGNVFTAQLSDDIGSFASPVSIGSTAPAGGPLTAPSGTINITIPAGIPSGTGYMIRVVSSNPAIIGSSSPAFQIIQAGLCASSHTDYYRSITSGNWNDPNTWESSTDGVTWLTPATLSPTFNAKNIYVRNGHTVALTSSVTVDQVEIQNGGILENQMPAANGLTVADGTGDDILIKSGGIYLVTSSQSFASNFTINSGAVMHIESGGTVEIGNGSAVGGSNNSYAITPTSFVWDDGSIFQWNSTTTPGVQVTFFPDATAGVVPIFRFTATPGFSMGGGTATVVNGRLEATSSIAFTGASTKTFRNGIVNSASIDGVSGTSLQFIINGTSAQLGGTGALSTPATGLQIGSASGTTTTVTSNKTITGDVSLVNTSYVDLGANTLTVSGNVSGGSTTAFIKTSGAGFLKLNTILTSKTFPIGKSGYNPLVISSASGNDFYARVDDGIHDPSGAIPTDAVLKTWYMYASAVTTGVTVTFQYANADCNAGALPQPKNMEILQSDYTTWHLSSGNNSILALGADPAWTITAVTPMSINNIPIPYALGVSGTLILSNDYFITARARKMTGAGQVSWTVGSADGVISFEVQRSVNNTGFITIGRVLPASGQTRYDFTDVSLQGGTNLYRIKVNRTTGGTRYSNTVALINDNKGLLLTSVAPNPVHDIALITLSAARAGAVQFDIFDIAGNKVKSWTSSVSDGNNTIPVNMSGLPAGIYQLLAQTAEARTIYRFVKQ